MHQYLVWASLACDHLTIVVSSLLSEWAFSSADITINKHCNQLKSDIVEALQFLKCLIRRDLIFHTDPSTSIDSDLNEDDNIGGSTLVPDTEKYLSSWDELWLEDDDATEG